MYLVEIEAGREVTYESVDAFVTAIQHGDLGPQSRIFHRASSSWISITLHPEYRKVVAAREGEPLPPLARKHWTFYGMEAKGREFDDPPVAPAKPAPQAAEPKKNGLVSLRRLLERAFRRRSAARNAAKAGGS